MDPEKIYMTIAQVAKHFRVTRAAVRKWIGQGRLKAHWVGLLIVLDRDEVRAFRRRRTGRPKEKPIKAKRGRARQGRA